MPPKRGPTAAQTSSVSRSSAISKRPRGGESTSSVGNALRNTYDALTAKENQSVVRAVGMFGVAVAFFASSYSDILPSMVPV
ncbi:hypothetical protein N7G274_005235 [Stereocaulon virgatum]|uniref:Uncharacterized protein n=1 Tax=Stereocaulon virgatum TaxID=373712 RepID=A0ABR4AC23_9LECA